MSWTQITRANNYQRFPADVLRMRKGTLALSPNVTENFQSQREQTPSGYEKLRFGLSVDSDAKAIKLDPQSAQGFTFRSKGNTAMIANAPTGLRRLELPIGDYKLTDKDNLVFTLAE